MRRCIAHRTDVNDIFVMSERAEINRRHDQSGLCKRKLVTGDSTMTEGGSYKLIARVQMEEWPHITAVAK
jgi:hypothetical protein